MQHKNLLTEVEQERLYLIHHMHHLEDSNEVIHELHHCFLFSKPDMQGEKFSVDHLFLKNKLYHILDRKAPQTLFDHANNNFSILEVEIDNKEYCVVT